MEEEKTEKIMSMNEIHTMINRDLKSAYKIMGLDYEKMMREEEAKENLKPKEENPKDGLSTPYGYTSQEELDQIAKTNPSLYMALVSWN